ncbi:MAG: hypothetical protein AAFV43_13000 [Planctomycetota bacterium]
MDYAAKATDDSTEEAPAFDAAAAEAPSMRDTPIKPEVAEPATEAAPRSAPDAAPDADRAEPDAAPPAFSTPPWRKSESEAAAKPPESDAGQRFFGGVATEESSATEAAVEQTDRSVPSTTDDDAATDEESYLEFLRKQYGVAEAEPPAEPAPSPEPAIDEAEPAAEPDVDFEVATLPDRPAAPELGQAQPITESEDSPLTVDLPAAPLVATLPPPPTNVFGPSTGLKIGELERPRTKRDSSRESAPAADVGPSPQPVAQSVPEPVEEFSLPEPAKTTRSIMPWDTPPQTEPQLASQESAPAVADPFDDPDSQSATTPIVADDRPPEPALPPGEEPAFTLPDPEPTTRVADAPTERPTPEAAEPRAPLIAQGPPQPELPVVQPPVVQPPAAEPTETEAAPPRTAATPEAGAPAMAAVEPLPAVPVLPYNTRHLSWLLGAKLGLAQLAGLEGATSVEVSQWSDEARRLAEQLDLKEPAPPAPSGSAERRLKQLLGIAETMGDRVARQHGPDHAALVEISLKTNALLVLFDEYPQLAAPVARAVTSAAERSLLPGRLWRDATRRIEFAGSADELYDAVTQMHADIEEYLR